MVSVGMATSPDPTNLICIHPTGGLDPRQRWVLQVPGKCLVFLHLSISWLFLIFPQILPFPGLTSLAQAWSSGKVWETGSGCVSLTKASQAWVPPCPEVTDDPPGSHKPTNEAGSGHLR